MTAFFDTDSRSMERLTRAKLKQLHYAILNGGV